MSPCVDWEQSSPRTPCTTKTWDRGHPAEAEMSVIDFFEYLAASAHTTDLTHTLADVWVARQIAGVFEPAA